MKGPAVPGRYGQAAAEVVDRKEQRRRDSAAGLVPFACKLPSELATTRDWRTRPDPFEQHWPEIAERLIAVEAMAREEMQKNPQVGVDAFVKHLSVTPEVAKATLDRECCGRVPSFADQLDPSSPFSMTSKDRGLVGKLLLASEVLAATRAIPQPIPLEKIQASLALDAYKKFRQYPQYEATFKDNEAVYYRQLEKRQVQRH